jgi:hypothetical protein
MVSDVSDIREAAGRDDWQACREACRQAMSRRGVSASIRLVHDQLADMLPAFERAHPGADWPRRALEHEVSDLPPDYPGPGANSLAKGIEHWRCAVALDGEAQAVDAVLDELVDALAESVMARVVVGWGALHPAEWADWYAAAQDPDAHEALSGPFLDGDGRELARQTWEGVAALFVASA